MVPSAGRLTSLLTAGGRAKGLRPLLSSRWVSWHLARSSPGQPPASQSRDKCQASETICACPVSSSSKMPTRALFQCGRSKRPQSTTQHLVRNERPVSTLIRAELARHNGSLDCFQIRKMNVRLNAALLAHNHKRTISRVPNTCYSMSNK